MLRKAAYYFVQKYGLKASTKYMAMRVPSLKFSEKEDLGCEYPSVAVREEAGEEMIPHLATYLLLGVTWFVIVRMGTLFPASVWHSTFWNRKKVIAEHEAYVEELKLDRLANILVIEFICI